MTGGYFRLDLEAPTACATATTQPGQFVMLRGDWGRDLINGRAFSVLDVESPERFSVLAKVFGRGTARLADAKVGETLTVTGPLGQGFAPAGPDVHQLLVAGGVGLPPLHFHARRAVAAGYVQQVELFYGGRSRDELVLLEEPRSWKIGLHLSTDDGSLGMHGRVTGPLLQRLDELRVTDTNVEILSCGPTPMLKAVREIALERKIPAQLCLEEQMACGFGVCLGCAVPVYGEKPYQYCCTDGPVFDAREVRWT